MSPSVDEAKDGRDEMRISKPLIGIRLLCFSSLPIPTGLYSRHQMKNLFERTEGTRVSSALPLLSFRLLIQELDQRQQR